MKKVIIHLLMAICVSLCIKGGNVNAANIDIKTSTESWFFPAKGEISDVFNSRGGEHKGIDIAGTYRSPVYAADKGKVVKSYLSQSYGNVVFIHHANGFETVYAHLAKRIVMEGEQVQKGEKIGLMGNTGEASGTHLHFEIHEGEWTIDKKYAIDPFIVFGNGEIGQLVFALQHDPYGIAEVSKPVIHEQQKDVLMPFYKAEELSYDLNKQSISLIYNTINMKNMDNNTYIVKKGDTLFSISKKFSISVDTLVNLNHIKNKDLIYPNQELSLDEKPVNILENVFKTK